MKPTRINADHPVVLETLKRFGLAPDAAEHIADVLSAVASAPPFFRDVPLKDEA